jgi:GNAT superfamily N-acetyltransferase
MDADITFRIARSREYPRIAEMYAGWGYRGDVSPEDVLYVAERGTQLVAAVRRTQEHELVLLRGLYVAPALQRRGIGSRLLDAFVNDLKDMRATACHTRICEASMPGWVSRRWQTMLRRISSATDWRRIVRVVWTCS